MRDDALRDSYDAVAADYVTRIARELEQKPFDRALLDRFAERVKGTGTVGDVGCGPGHVARYLNDLGVTMCGVDLSPAMVEIARRLHAGITFLEGNMRALPVADGAWSGIVAFYSLIHIAPAEMVTTLRELGRVLRDGAPLLIAFHVGDETLHLDEWWERPVSVDFHFFRPEQMASWLAESGFDVEEVLERDPYPPEVEHQSRRCYVTARVISLSS